MGEWKSKILGEDLETDSIHKLLLPTYILLPIPLSWFIRKSAKRGAQTQKAEVSHDSPGPGEDGEDSNQPCRRERGLTQRRGHIWPAACFHTASKLTRSNGWAKKEKKNIWNLHEIQLSGSISKVLLGQNHAHLLKYCLWLFSCYDGRLDTTETLWLIMPEYVSPGPLQRKFAISRGLSRTGIIGRGGWRKNWGQEGPPVELIL